MQPQHPRIDPLALLANALDEPGHSVLSSVDAALDPVLEPVTVVQIPAVEPVGSLGRWSFRVEVSLTTFADTSAKAWEPHAHVADRLLALTQLGSVRISSIRCNLEPVNIAGRAPQWPGVVSTYVIFMREESTNG